MGIPLKVHISLVVLATISIIQFRFLYGLFFAAGLVISIALHELGHSFVAIKKGCKVREITLLLLGGAAQMESIPTRPKDELLMAVTGPLVSLFLGACGILGGSLLPLPAMQAMAPAKINIVELLGLLNLVLAFFNLIPAFPMDGGRVFRSLLSRKMGRLKATYVAAQLGKIIAVLFGIYAIHPFNPILIAIAFFVYIMAGNEYKMVQMQEAAKHYGWNIGAYGRQNENNDDEVMIGPPPYEDGPGTRSGIRPNRKDRPFNNFLR